MSSLGRFYKRNRKGLFIALFENNAVTVGTKLAVDSMAAIRFVSGLAVDPQPRGFESPCPRTEMRIRAFNAAATAASTAAFVRDAPPSEVMASYTILPYAVQEERG